MIMIKAAVGGDAEALAELAEEMDRFYGATEAEPLQFRVRQIKEAICGDPPAANSLLASDDGELAGFASYSFLWPAVGLSRSLYLKELYVAETARRKGVGQLLMRRLYEIAVEQGCSRVEWTTDRENSHAQRFYAGLGVSVHESKLFYRLEGSELRRQAGLP